MIDWGKLVSQGRAKAPGVAWNEMELKARYSFKIPADYVRKGILTTEDYQKALKEGVKPTSEKSKVELMKEAKERNIEATPDAPKEVVADLIDEDKAKAKKTTKVAPKAKKAVKKNKK